MNVLVLNGPNLNLLGEREPDVYGKENLEDLRVFLSQKFQDIQFEFYQSNIEGELINALHRARLTQDGVVFNPGAFAHYAIALRDAIKSIEIPVVEVHLSNIASREEFRRGSVVAPVCIGQISGFGFTSYLLGIEALRNTEK